MTNGKVIIKFQCPACKKNQITDNWYSKFSQYVPKEKQCVTVVHCDCKYCNHKDITIKVDKHI